MSVILRAALVYLRDDVSPRDLELVLAERRLRADRAMLTRRAAKIAKQNV
jgi:transposase-like protein